MEIQHADKVLKHAYFGKHKRKGSRRRYLSNGIGINHANKKRKKKGLFGRIAKGIISGGASEVVRNRKKIGSGLKKIGKIAAGAALLPALIPLMPVMAAALKAKGLKPSRKPRQLAEQFYKSIVKKNSHYDKPDTAGEDHFLPIAVIIPPIIQFVKSMIGKKKSGQKLSKVEKVIADGSENVVEKIKEEVPGATSQDMPGSNSKDSGEGVGDENSKPTMGGKKAFQVGSMRLSMPIMLGIGGAVILVIFLVMKKK